MPEGSTERDQSGRISKKRRFGEFAKTDGGIGKIPIDRSRIEEVARNGFRIHEEVIEFRKDGKIETEVTGMAFGLFGQGVMIVRIGSKDEVESFFLSGTEAANGHAVREFCF